MGEDHLFLFGGPLHGVVGTLPLHMNILSTARTLIKHFYSVISGTDSFNLAMAQCEANYPEYAKLILIIRGKKLT